MSRVPAVAEACDDPNVRAVFEEIQSAFGRVPNLFRTYAVHPPLLRANWEKVKAVLMSGNLRREVKEAIALLVSKDNSCAYCVAAHTAVLRAVGMTEEQIVSMEEDFGKTDFNDKEKALIGLARAANLKPLKVSDEEFGAVRQTGATDAEIVEALGVMEVFTSFNKFLDVLQVEIDF